MNAKDLQKFCDTDMVNGRCSISKPWSAGQYTYSANGHIMVRVPRLADVPENQDAPKRFTMRSIDEAFNAQPVKWYTIPAVNPKTGECDACNGKGRYG